MRVYGAVRHVPAYAFDPLSVSEYARNHCTAAMKAVLKKLLLLRELPVEIFTNL